MSFVILFKQRMNALFMYQQVTELIIKNIFAQEMFSKTHSFRDFDFENLNEHHSEVEDSKLWCHASPGVKCIVDPTAQNQSEAVEDFFLSRPSKNGVRDYQISFQASFMDEHQSAFKKQTENFIESSFKSTEDHPISFSSQGLFHESFEQNCFSSQECSQVLFEEKEKLLKLFEGSEKLIQFFQFLKKTQPKGVVSQLSYTAYFALDKFSKIKDQVLNERGIQKLGSDLATELHQKLFNDQRIKFLNLRRVSDEKLKDENCVLQGFKDYIDFFFVTVLLVSEEYFENPYNEKESPKRQRSFNLEDEFDDNDPSCTDSIFSLRMPTKKLH